MKTQTKTQQKEEYKETDLGLLPKEWESIELKKLIETKKGRKPKMLTEDWQEGCFPYLTANYFRTGKPSKFSEAGSNYNIEVEKDDIVFIWDGSNAGDVFTGLKGILASTMVRITPSDERTLKKFLFYFIKTKFDLFNTQTTGSTIPHVSKNLFCNLLVPLPPFPEQRNIAFVLSSTQEAKEKTEAVVFALRETKRSLMKHLFTYGLVPIEEAEDVELKETEIGKMPKDWKLLKLQDVSDFKNGINFSREQKGKKGILTIDVLNMYQDKISVDVNNLYRVDKKLKDDYLLKGGDILFVRSSLKQEGVGRASLFKEANEPITFCGFIIRARLNTAEFFPEYLVNYLRTPIAKQNLVTSSGKLTITNINQGMLGKTLLPKPHISVQKEIADILFTVDARIEAEQNKVNALGELFNSLLRDLMTAKVRVKDLVVANG